MSDCFTLYLIHPLQGPRYSLDKHLEDTTKHHLSLMCQMSLRHEKQIQQLTSRLQTLNRVTDGTYSSPGVKVV